MAQSALTYSWLHFRMNQRADPWVGSSAEYKTLWETGRTSLISGSVARLDTDVGAKMK